MMDEYITYEYLKKIDKEKEYKRKVNGKWI